MIRQLGTLLWLLVALAGDYVRLAWVRLGILWWTGVGRFWTWMMGRPQSDFTAHRDRLLRVRGLK